MCVNRPVRQPISSVNSLRCCGRGAPGWSRYTSPMLAPEKGGGTFLDDPLEGRGQQTRLRQLRVLARRGRRDGALVNCAEVACARLCSPNCDQFRRGVAACTDARLIPETCLPCILPQPINHVD